MSKDLKPQSPIAIRFQHDLKINGNGIRTQQTYVRMLRKFTEFLGDEPDAACEEDLRRYFLHISENQLWKPSTVNVRSNTNLPLACPAAGLLEQGLRCWLVSPLPTVLTPPNETPRPYVSILVTQHLIFYLLCRFGVCAWSIASNPLTSSAVKQFICVSVNSFTIRTGTSA